MRFLKSELKASLCLLKNIASIFIFSRDVVQYESIMHVDD